MVILQLFIPGFILFLIEDKFSDSPIMFSQVSGEIVGFPVFCYKIKIL